MIVFFTSGTTIASVLAKPNKSRICSQCFFFDDECTYFFTGIFNSWSYNVLLNEECYSYYCCDSQDVLYTVHAHFAPVQE